jgi:hypothetical protein
MEHRIIEWTFATSPGSALGLLALALGLGAAIATLRSLRGLPPSQRRTLASLATVLLFVLLIVTAWRPRRTVEHRRPRDARTAVLVDDSLSMTLPLHVGAGTGNEKSKTAELQLRERIAVARGIARDWRGQMPEARFLDFDGKEADLREDGANPPRRSQSPLIDRLDLWVHEGVDGRVPDRIGLLSDLNDLGSSLEPERVARLERSLTLRRRPVLFAVDLGATSAAPDLRVREIRADTVAFYKNVSAAEVGFEATSMPPGPVDVSFGVNGRWLETRRVELALGQASATARFEYRPDETGTIVLGAQVTQVDPVDPAGASAARPRESNRVNNTRLARQRVLRDRLRVLHLAGHPSWDVRFLRDALKNGRQADLISFYIMVRPSAFFVENLENTVLIPFPTHTLFEEELAGFDLLIFQNFRFGAFETDVYAERIAGFVEGGGASLVVGGEFAFLAEGLADTAAARLFPVGVPRFKTYRDYFALGAFSPRLTTEGLVHPILSGNNMPKDVAGALGALPDLIGANLQGCPLEGASVLLAHPKAKTSCGPLPILATSALGEGRIAFVATDSLWRWRFLPGEPEQGRFYQALIDNIVRWLIRDPTLAPFEIVVGEAPAGGPTNQKAGDDETDDGAQASNAPRYEIRAILRRTQGAPEHTWALRVTQWGSSERQATRLQKAPAPTFAWAPPEPGLYWIELERRDGSGNVSAKIPYLVQADPEEFLEPSEGRALIHGLIKASGGQVAPPGDAARGLQLPATDDVEVLRREHDEPLSSVWLLPLLLALMTWIWYLRSAHDA